MMNTYAGTDASSVASTSFCKEAVEDTKYDLLSKEHVIWVFHFIQNMDLNKERWKHKQGCWYEATIDQLNSDGQVAVWNDDCGQYVASYTVKEIPKTEIWFEEREIQ